MIGGILTRRIFLRNIRTFRSSVAPRLNLKANIPSKIFFLTTSPPLTFFTRENMENFDLKLQQACEHGEKGINELMEHLRNGLNEIGNSYKDCLKKQIDIIDKATKAGPDSSKWDELPEFRTLATDLSQQYNNFVATINTIGQLSENEALKYITQQEKLFKQLSKKYRELEKVIQKHSQDIKKLEDKLLEKNRDSIENTKNN